MSKQFTVSGRIQRTDGGSPEKLIVRAINRHLRHEQELGWATPDAEGHYEISYGKDLQLPESGGAALVVRVVGPAGQLFGASETLFHAPPKATIDLSVPQGEIPRLSEYELTVALVAPLLDGATIGDLRDEDLAFLAADTGQPLKDLQALRVSAQRAVATRVPAEAFYGLSRRGLPTDSEGLAKQPLDSIEDGIESAAKKNLIPLRFAASAGQLARQLRKLADVSHRALFRLVRAGTSEPMRGQEVRVVDLDSLPTSQDLGSKRTSSQGLLTVAYAADANAPVGRHLQLEILDADGKVLVQLEVHAGDDAAPPVDVSVVLPAPPPIPSPPITELASSAGIALPEELMSTLAARGIQTVADLRAAGGLGNLPGIVALDQPEVRALRAHVDLLRLSTDTRVHTAFIAAGFESVAAVGAAPRVAAMAAVAPIIGDYKAGRLHAEARAQTNVLKNVLAGIAADRANGVSVSTPQLAMDVALPDVCNCDDCEAAVSPAAYLVDLLTYTSTHLSLSGLPVTVQALGDTFMQPFADLPASCEAQQRRVRQVRIFSEIMWRYLTANPPTPSQQTALALAEHAYVVAAYLQLLTRAGCSYEAVRLARSGDADARGVLAEQLGIDLTLPRPPGDELDELFLDPAAAVGDPKDIDEATLERLFGLADTTRDPLSDGAKQGDVSAELVRWQLEPLHETMRGKEGVEWNRNTDERGFVFVRLINPAAGVYRVELYRDRARTLLVASGQCSTATGSVDIQPENGSDLSGRFEIAFQTGGDGIEIAVVPTFLSWRLRHLRRTWLDQDQPPDAYSDGAVSVLPLVDPDLIGVDDLRSPRAPDTAFNLWLARRSFVDGTLISLKATREASGTTAVLEQAFGSPLPDLDGLLASLTQGTDPKGASEAIKKFGLTTDSFLRLMAIRALDQLATSDPVNLPVTDGQWGDLYSILAQAGKVGRFAAWRAEEQGDGLLLGPDSFWISLREPKEGDWPPAPTPDQPRIDPDLITRNDLPEGVAGTAALAMWTDRRKAIDLLTKQLQAMRESSSLDAALSLALGHPSPGDPLPDDLKSLALDLANSDPKVVAAAGTTIATDLFLTVDDFIRLMALKSKSEDPDPLKRPTAKEWMEVYVILTGAQKRKRSYPKWILNEQAAAMDTAYWLAVKARLHPWRATSESRAAWQQALRNRSNAPVIEPDLIGPGDLRYPVGAPATILAAREAWMTAELAALDTQRRLGPTELDGFDAIVLRELGIKGTDLSLLDDQQQAGTAISPRLDQLLISSGAFDYLLRIRRLAKTTQPILETEWTDVYSILAQAQKQRRFAIWRGDERTQGIVLSPDQFALPKPPTNVFGAPPLPDLPRWRATMTARLDWQDTLQSRIDQDGSTHDSWDEVVSSVEEVTLPKLRDALIDATTLSGDFNDKAKQLTRLLQIDAQAGGCQRTTRVAQAIETIQGLVWSVQLGQLVDVYPTMTLDRDQFDALWQWLGSYATWRAAMFVFLYPENILLPTLRRWSTPAFDTLANNLRAKRPLTPSTACDEAGTFSDYFKDVCSMYLECSCQTLTRLHRSDSCAPSENGYRCLMYLFGVGRSGSLYWSAYDPQDATGYAQSSWKKIAIDGFSKIVGAVPYRRSIYLFVDAVDDNGAAKLAYLTYDLEDTGEWASRGPLKLPANLQAFDIVTKQTDDEDQAPHVVIKDRANGGIYHGTLNNDGSAWTGLEFENWSGGDYLEAVFRYQGDSFYMVESGMDLGWSYILVSLHRSSQDPNVSYQGAYGVFYRGGYTWPNSSDVFLLTSEGEVGPGDPPLPDSSPFVAPNNPAGLWLLHDDGVGALVPLQMLVANPVNFGGGTIVPSSGFVLDDGTKQRLVGYVGDPIQPSDSTLCRVELTRFDSGSLTVRESDRRRGTPLMTGPYDIGEYGTPESIQVRRALIEKAFLDNSGEAASNLIYLEEAYYFVPLQIALQLLQVGQVAEALSWFRTTFDYSAPTGQQKIYYPLVQEQSLPALFTRATDWLLDPLNPHAIAATRWNCYTRYTLLSIVGCLLQYADSEFSLDTAESIPRARRLYQEALQLLDSPELKANHRGCDTLIETVALGIAGPRWIPVMAQIRRELGKIGEPSRLQVAVEKVRQVLSSNVGAADRVVSAWGIVKSAAVALPQETVGRVLKDNQQLRATRYEAALSLPVIAEAARAAGEFAGSDFRRTVSMLTGISAPNLERRPLDLPWLRGDAVNGLLGGGSSLVDPAAPMFSESLMHAASNAPGAALALGTQVETSMVPSVESPGFCIPPNPIPMARRFHAELNLFKMRNCRDIAGTKRELDPYVAPTDTTTGMPVIGAGGQLVLPGIVTLRPTLYRYSILIERAKQQAQLASQVEASMLAALLMHDQAGYTLLKARQDLNLAQAGLQLQDLRVTAAKDGVTLAGLQQARAQKQADYYQHLLEQPINDLEQEALQLWDDAANLLSQSAVSSATVAELSAQLAGGFSGAAAGVGFDPSAAAAFLTSAAGFAIGSLSALGAIFGSLSGSDSARASRLSTLASYERRQQDWQFQQTMADQDISIGAEQVTIAADQVQVVTQERTIAQIQVTNDKDTVEFLHNQFGSVDLFDWMSGVLGGVYAFFLQQATVTARLAQNQLAFERQEVPPAMIQPDYWEAPSDGGGANSSVSNGPDRRGVTGSARLLQDISQLDQYAFDTDKRKLQLTKTISLALLSPGEFQRFRETGVMTFATPMEMFDRDFPGHYLRLVRRIRLSVVALIPPTQGIHATFSSTGLSRVVIGGDIFQTVPIRRDPEVVALSSPSNASGILELDPQSEMLLPFEGCGVDSTWEFRLPRPSNLFEFRTIADVLVTIEYTALNSFDYQQQVIQTLRPNISSDRPFSFRNELSDQWYDLHNPDQSSTPMVVGFSTTRADFPPNLDSLRIQQLALYFAREDGQSFEVPVDWLHFTETKTAGFVGGGAASIDGVISTRRGNAGGWAAMIGKAPVGQWELALPDTSTLRELFDSEAITDMIFIVTYSGRPPDWPA